MFKVNNKDNRMTPMASLWFQHSTYFTSAYSVLIVNFEHRFEQNLLKKNKQEGGGGRLLGTRE